MIENGDVDRAGKWLGYPVFIKGVVQSGHQRGRTLGFPTANFIPEEKNQLIPVNGVYFIRGRINGKNLYGMCNLGIRPTFDETEFVMEAHFFDLSSSNIYGKIITVEFLERIRDEVKFSNSTALIEQLNKDKQICMRLMQKYK